jgi:hypothetical protein
MLFEKKYKECYEKIVIETNQEAEKITKKFDIFSVPFLVTEQGEVLSAESMRNFIRNI